MTARVAIVLSGGGAKGAYEAGALKSIARRAERVDILTGASIGAINAAIFATRYEETGSLERAAMALEDVWKGVQALFRLSWLRVVASALGAAIRTRSRRLPDVLSFPSLVDDSQVRKTITELIPDVRISDIKSVDLAINATDLNAGRTVTFHRNNDANLREAVLASMSIPVIFPSRYMSGSYYVDGGVFNNTPLRDALVLGATQVCVIGLRPQQKEDYLKAIVDPKPFRGVYDVSTRLVELILDKIMYEDLKNARRLNKVLAVIAELERTQPDSPAVKQLKEAIGYEKNGRVKHIAEFIEINPKGRLEPPGTLGFDQKDAILRIMEMGERDAEAQLRNVTLGKVAPGLAS